MLLFNIVSLYEIGLYNEGTFMALSQKIAKRIHILLDTAEIPEDPQERAKIFSTLFSLQRHQSRAIIDGYLLPNDSLLEDIANEFETTVKWLKEGD